MLIPGNSSQIQLEGHSQYADEDQGIFLACSLAFDMGPQGLEETNEKQSKAVVEVLTDHDPLYKVAIMFQWTGLTNWCA